MKNRDYTLGTCLIYIIMFVPYLWAAGKSIDYLTQFFGLNDVSVLWDTLLGLFLGQFSIPVALIIYLFF